MIVVDWGSTGFRAWRLGNDGAILDRVSAQLGITTLNAGEHGVVLYKQVGHWLRDGESFVVTSGMIGSRQGWHEMPYVPCPAGLSDLARAAQRVKWSAGPDVWFCPGLSCRDAQGVPDVIRGEEVQIFGLLEDGAQETHFCLPGTHSKSLVTQGGRILNFATHFTGELYALLGRHGLLASVLQQSEKPDDVAFAEGVARGADPGGLLHHLFGVRARALFGELSGPAASEYLSGMLIGHEMRQLPEDKRILLVGEAGLTGRYALAARLLGLKAETALPDAAARGLYKLGCLLQ